MAVGAAAVGTAALVGTTGALLPKGPETASLTVTFRSGGHSSFAGTLAGEHLSGKFVKTDPSMLRKLCQNEPPQSGLTFSYAGKFHGKSYSFSGCVDYLDLTFHIVGHLGSTAFSGATLEGSTPNRSSWTLPFKVRAGKETITGTAVLRGGQRTGTVTAHLKVTG